MSRNVAKVSSDFRHTAGVCVISRSVAKSAFLRHEVCPLGRVARRNSILRRKVFLYGSRLRRYSPLETIVPETFVTGDYRAFRYIAGTFSRLDNCINCYFLLLLG